MDLINKINNELYNDNSQQISIEKIQKICRKEDHNNTRKTWNEKKIQINRKSIKSPNIRNKFKRK